MALKITESPQKRDNKITRIKPTYGTILHVQAKYMYVQVHAEFENVVKKFVKSNYKDQDTNLIDRVVIIASSYRLP